MPRCGKAIVDVREGLTRKIARHDCRAGLARRELVSQRARDLSRIGLEARLEVISSIWLTAGLLGCLVPFCA